MREPSNELFHAENISLDPGLRDEIARFSRSICAGIRSKRARRAAEDELVDHIHGALYDAALRGIPPERALPDICASFGDPAVLRQQLAGVHNRLPPDLLPALGRFLLRLVAAVLTSGFLCGLIGESGYAVGITVGVLILCGLRPLYALRRAEHRLRFRGQLRRLCRRSGRALRSCPSILRVLLAPSATALYVVQKGKYVTVIRFLSVSPREAVRFVDDTSLLRIRRRSGVGLADRRPGQFNLSQTAAVGYETLRPASFSYRLPSALAAVGNGDVPSVEKLLVLDDFPRELSAVEGNAVRELIHGDRLFDFAVHSRASCLSYLTDGGSRD